MRAILGKFISFTIMMGLWYCFSSETSFLFIFFAIAAIVLTFYLCRFLEVVDKIPAIHYMQVIRVIRYYLWIIKEVFSASADVSRRVWSAYGSSNSGFCELELPKTNDLGLVIFANSITLTPGTITVYLSKNCIVVHAIDQSVKNELQNKQNDMMSKVNKLIDYKNG